MCYVKNIHKFYNSYYLNLKCLGYIISVKQYVNELIWCYQLSYIDFTCRLETFNEDKF